jgi:hypothetical protein
MNNIEIVTPLDAGEIKQGIAHLIAQAVMERLDKHCQLYGQAYPKFRANITLHIELDSYGQSTFVDTSTVATNTEIGEQLEQPVVVEDLEVTIPFTPPNQFRRDTEQEVPTATPSTAPREDSTMMFKAKRGRPAKKG